VLESAEYGQLGWVARMMRFDQHAPVAAPVDVRLMNVAALVLSVLALALALVFVSRWALAHPVFAVSRIIVEGDTQHHNGLTLQANVASRISGNFFTLDLTQARKAFESVSWVRQAQVRREFPNRLRVKLEEHRVVGYWGSDTESRLVNSHGEVFEANVGDSGAEELPRLMGPESQSVQVLEMYKRLNAAFAGLDAVVEELRLSEQGAWAIVLDTGTEIELGRGKSDEVMMRLQKFLGTHAQVLSAYQRSGLDRIESVDLRHALGYAIRMRGVTTVAPPTPGKA
jgi:cell division protein FtsQ